MFQIKSYFKFLLKSTNEHGVHSPFVFSLVTQCFYDRKHYNAYDVLKNYRHWLNSDKGKIEVTDFGAGSRVFKSNERRVCDIAKNAGISKRHAELLHRITHYLKARNILEIGTSLGIATAAMAEANRDAIITTLEGCPATAEVASGMFRQFGYGNIKLKVTEFNAFLTSEHINSQKYDLIYFDGNHTRAATLSYFTNLLPTVTNNTCWIFDDIHWSADMQRAWETIKKHSAVSLTIDTYQWGIVFFRKEQTKEHFVIRI